MDNLKIINKITKLPGKCEAKYGISLYSAHNSLTDISANLGISFKSGIFDISDWTNKSFSFIATCYKNFKGQ